MCTSHYTHDRDEEVTYPGAGGPVAPIDAVLPVPLLLSGGTEASY